MTCSGCMTPRRRRRPRCRARNSGRGSVVARVLYTRYCAFDLSTRILAWIQRLARTIHIRHSRTPAFTRHRARSPHRQRVAIKRHEFHPQSHVALATPVFGADRSSVSASALPSLFALARGTTARSAVSVTTGASRRSSEPTGLPARFRRIALRASCPAPRNGVAFVAPATPSHDRICVPRAHRSAVTRLAWSATRAAASWPTPRYACLLEAV